MRKSRPAPPEAAPLTEMLAEYGFAFVQRPKKRRSWVFREYLYVNGLRYVKVSASLNWRDIPWCCLVSLGVDGISPYSDSVALWRMVRAKSPDHYPEGQEPYPLDTVEDIPRMMPRICEDLRQFGLDFLTGDLTVYNEQRIVQEKAASESLATARSEQL